MGDRDLITRRLETFVKAAATLSEAITLFREYGVMYVQNATESNKRFFLATRDSVVKRFAYTVDLFLKTLKVYLEEVEKVDITTNSPRGIIRAAVKVKTLSEGEGEECIEMVTSRNQTSHIYHEEIAEDIAGKVPTYYELMNLIVDRVSSKTL